MKIPSKGDKPTSLRNGRCSQKGAGVCIRARVCVCVNMKTRSG